MPLKLDRHTYMYLVRAPSLPIILLDLPISAEHLYREHDSDGLNVYQDGHINDDNYRERSCCEAR
jgi:hypothetical protein